MNEQLTLDLPVTPDEAKPWEVEEWRYHVEYRVPFLTREDAIEYMARRFDADDCWIKSLWRPDGSEDREARDQASDLSWG